MMRRRDLLIAGLGFTAAGVAEALRPRRKLVLLQGGTIAQAVPEKFGVWTAEGSDSLVSPDQAGRLAKTLYSEIVQRIYHDDSTGAAVMVLAAYGDTQSDLLQLHRPESCYPAVGFNIESSVAGAVQLPGGASIIEARAFEIGPRPARWRAALGVVAVAALVALVIVLGTGSLLRKDLVAETYFNESVQGLDIGSKMKYRGVTIGEVTRISFTYTKYELDRPMSQRKRYVLVEAQLEPRLVGGRVANDIASPASVKIEVERGLRVHLAPQGITGTNYLELDYVDTLPAPVVPIDWEPENIYIPSTPSTVSTFVSAASEILDRLHRLDIESTVANLNKLLVTATSRVEGIDSAGISKGVTDVAQRTDRTLAKIEKTLDGIAAKKLSDEAVGLIAELRQTNGELKTFLANPSFRKLPDDTSAALASVRQLVGDPRLPQSIAHLERTLARLDRIFGAGEADLSTTFDNLRQITDNLRDLSEDAKRYPSNLLFGAPPQPLGHTP